MKEHLNQLNQRREYYEEIATERAIKEAEAEEAERIRVSVIIGVRYFFFQRMYKEGDTRKSAKSDLWCGRSEEILCAHNARVQFARQGSVNRNWKKLFNNESGSVISIIGELAPSNSFDNINQTNITFMRFLRILFMR